MSLAAGLALFSQSSQAQTLVDTWSYDRSPTNEPQGGGFDPATYSGTFRPAVLTPDAGSDGGGTISVIGMTTGGLGSSGYPEGYGGYYTFFSDNPSFTLESSTLLDGVDTITISFLASAGDGPVNYNASYLTLNYNLANPALAATSYNVVTGFVVDSPLGPQNLNLYTWTFTGLSGLGESTGYSTSWVATGHHVYYGEISVTQAVPEPTATCLIALGGVAIALRRKRRTMLSS